ncbi:autotransporter domain-containing protein [Bradyrhizobium guangdongense]|uniref:outer membrane protein n=1 Tax=Bradyrhizobium guangdongense TaxID=1325090 RepID=UPI00112866EE|nr:autotransporter domain-containing protein [Bradyrhizobium guangdongense]TPQ30115.1 autotransporter domain-containing protein [Bradyrhizobium guangdongense]
MKEFVLALTAGAVMTGSACAADLAARPYAKAPTPVASWTGFYVFGGAGGGLWAADSSVVAIGPPPAGFGALPPPGTTIVRDGRLGGSGWFATVGAGYDWQSSNWVAGVFADGQFGEIRGTLSDPFFQNQGDETLRTSYAAGVRLGYLVAPNVLSYVNAGYTGSEWSGAALTGVFPGGAVFRTTPSFHRDGWFVGGGVENSLNIFGIAAPGWFMKTEYRSAFYSRATLPETNIFPGFVGTQTGTAVTFKPWTQTVSTSLVYRFNSPGMAPATTERLYTKAPVPVANWTGFYAFGGAGGGLWAADSNAFVSAGLAGAPITTLDRRYGGSGWFGTVGAGYDRQFGGNWVAGVFADGQFGDIRGSLADPFFGLVSGTEGQEKLRTSYAVGVRLGYLVAPNVLSYVNAGYSGSDWSGTTQSFQTPGGVALTTTPSFHRDGWFVGGGVENSLNIFGVAAPGWFMKTEYRSAFYDRISLPETFVPGNPAAGALSVVTPSFKPWVQTISTALVYRFNSPVVAKY